MIERSKNAADGGPGMCGSSGPSDPGGTLLQPLSAYTGQPLELAAIRCFSTGATRDTDRGKLDYEGFEAPAVLRRFAEFMHRHRIQSDGTLRDSDNWQRGIPKEQYAKSLIRHVVEFWLAHRGHGVHPAGERDPQDIEELLCAIRFNASGYLFELLKERDGGQQNEQHKQRT